ncbi:unnamed protein product, partial [Adineta steineri]
EGAAVKEEAEAEKLIQTIGDQSSDEMTQQLGNDGNTHSPSVIPKTQKIADVQNIDTPVNDGKQSDDEQDNGDHGISNNTRKENNVEMKETDKKYYCEFCASGGFDKKVGLSQHMTHRQLNEYNATIEVPMKKRLWTRDDMLILAGLEANPTFIETINSNSALALKLPSRSREATKKRRQNDRIQDAATTESTIVNSLTIANDSINVNNDSGNHSSNDRSQGTQIGTSNESYPDIRQYIKTNIVKGRIRLCQTMWDAMTHYVNDVPNSDPVNESLIGIHQATNSVQSSQSHKDDRQTIESKLRSATSIPKAQIYAHHQRLFKKNKSKLASEIFGGVDNSALKPPMFVAYEHYRNIWTIDTKDAVLFKPQASAFDSVPHDSIKRALMKNECPFEFIDLFNNQYENSYTAVSYADRSSRLIALRRGVKQGDPMSSILFYLVIDELCEILGDRFGYELDGVGSVNAGAFADDIALMSGSELGMQQLLSETEKFLTARGLELNTGKCISICLWKAGKVKKSQIADSSVTNPPKFTVKNKPVQLLGVDKFCRYLGVQFTPLGAVDPRVSVSELKSALTSLAKAPLKSQQKVVMLRTYLIPRFIFAFTHTECYPKLMRQQDRLITRWLKETLKLPPSVCSDFFYLPDKEGGLGIGKLYDIIGIAKTRLYSSFFRAGDECLRFLVETQGSTMHSRWCNAMKLSDRPSAADINQSNVLLINESRIRLAETVHGSVSTVFRESPITNQWLSGYTRIIKGRTYIKAIQMRTNTIPTRVSTNRGQNTNKACRRCGLADETLIHILQSCLLTQGMICRRHNDDCRKVSDKYSKQKGFKPLNGVDINDILLQF